VRSEEEIKIFYKQYIYRWGKATVEMDSVADQYLGAAFAYGRILGRSMKQIDSDLKRAKRVAERKA
jgi:hypothetical protein